MQGVAGLSARDIKLIVDGGFNTIESVAYTYGSVCAQLEPLLIHYEGRGGY